MQLLKAITLILCTFYFALAQANTQTLWQKVGAEKPANDLPGGQVYRLDLTQMRQQLLTAPLEDSNANASSKILLPVATGVIERFTLQESPIMQSGLAARYPDIKTYKIYGIDDPQASGRISMSPAGFHGMITGPTGTFYIDPQGNDLYQAFRKRDLRKSQTFHCDVEEHNHQTPAGQSANRGLASRTARNLRVYRTAIAGTVEFVTAVGGSKSAALTSVTNTINRINQIYERDLGVRLVLINNTDSLFFTGTDNYSNGNSFSMLSENQTVITNAIGAANYDIGHVFGTGGGGVARLGAVCLDSAKARGVSNGFNFSGDSFAIDLVAHEIGHQFNAGHSFNGTTNGCGSGNRSSSSAVEPGSGSTIMAYSGICGSENIQNPSSAMFHAHSIDTIDAYTTSGRGANCGTLVSITNPNEPNADAGNNFTIPVSTPFVLTANGTDSDGDSLSYSWDQMDMGTATNSGTLGTDLGDNPLMRSYLPRSTKSRYFPQLETVVAGGSDKAETLPTTDRSLNFRVNIRDGKSGLGRDNVTITSENNAGPFVVTSHSGSASLSGGDSQTVTWNVANTDQSPVSCAGVNIDILLLDNSKDNYCVERLANATPNDGSATITLPNLSTPKARFRVSCSDNIFYALSGGDLQLTGASGASTNCHSVESETEEQGGSNSAPVLSIDAPNNNSSFLQSATITFTGSANDNEDGNISANITWTSNIDGNLGNGASITATPSIGTHRITAGIVDSDNATDSNFITVTVTTTPPASNTTPVVTITGPTNGLRFKKGDSITFSGIANDTEDGDISSKIAWSSSLDGSMGTGGNLNLSNLNVGEHKITASITDTGNATDSKTIDLTVFSLSNNAPTISILSPSDKSTFRQNDKITLSGKASDTEDGDISNTIDWSSDLDGVLGTGKDLNLKTLSVGMHSITARITDSNDNKAVSSIAITVSAAGGGQTDEDDNDSGGGAFAPGWLFVLIMTGIAIQLRAKKLRSSRVGPK